MAQDPKHKTVYATCPRCAEKGDRVWNDYGQYYSPAELDLKQQRVGKDVGKYFLGCQNFKKTGCRYTSEVDQCFLCDGKLQIKVNKAGHLFLGCRNFSSRSCKYTRPVPRDEDMRHIYHYYLPFEAIKEHYENMNIEINETPSYSHNDDDYFMPLSDEASSLGFGSMLDYNEWRDQH